MILLGLIGTSLLSVSGGLAIDPTYTCADVNDDLHDLENKASKEQEGIIQFAESCMEDYPLIYGTEGIHEEQVATAAATGPLVIKEQERCTYYYEGAVDVFEWVCSTLRAKAKYVDDDNCDNLADDQTCIAASGDASGRSMLPPKTYDGTTWGFFFYSGEEDSCAFGVNNGSPHCTVNFPIADAVFLKRGGENDSKWCSIQSGSAEARGGLLMGTEEIDTHARVECDDVI